MKRRSITLAICILAVLALASIGFASWIISNPEASGHDEGSILVDDVTSQVYEVTAALSNETIQYGVPTGYSPKPTDWLTNNSGKFDSLETILTVVIKPEDGADVNATLNAAALGVTLTGVKSGTEYDTAGLNKLFTDAGLPAPVMTIKSGAEWVAFDGTINYTDLVVDATSGTAQIKITFSWGTNGNPYTYYNGTGHSYAQDREKAEEFLGKVYAALYELSYKVTIK